MAVEIKAGVWKRRDGKVTIVLGRGPGGFWQCSDGSARFDDGRSWSDRNDPEDLVEWIDVLEGPGQPQPDAAEEHRQTELNELSAELETIRDVCDGLSENLAELREDRDRWQTRAVQAEGRVKTLTQDLMRKHDELVAARQQLQDRDAADQVPGNEQLRQQITQLIAEREELSQQTRCDAEGIAELRAVAKALERRLEHSEQQRSILLETSQDQLGQIRMAERVISIMADKVAQLAVERGLT